ncbi:MAG: regulatory protein RecX [Spirochaetota bacterium]
MIVTLVSYSGDAVKLIFDTADCLILPVRIEYSALFAKGAEISRERFEELALVSEKYLCTRAAVTCIARAPKTALQLKQYLKKKEYSEPAVADALVYMYEHHYIDDADYAKRFIRSAKRRKAVGALKLKAELMQKGVAKPLIDEALNETGFAQDSYDEVYAAALKKARSVTGKKNARQKLVFFLKSRGFRDDLSRKAMRALEKEGLIEDLKEED